MPPGRRRPPPPRRYVLAAPPDGGAPWASLIRTVLQQRFGDADSPAARALYAAWSHSLAASSYASYASKLRGFIEFCAREGRCPLPATGDTLELYVGFMLDRGTVQARYLPQYVSAIRRLHRDLMLPPPDSTLVSVIIRGGEHLQRARLAAPQHAPLTATDALACLVAASGDGGVAAVRRACAAVALAFAVFWRKSSVVGLRRDHVARQPDGSVHLIEAVRKGHAHDPVLRRLRVACARGGRPILAFMLRRWEEHRDSLWAATGGEPTHYFQLPGERFRDGDGRPFDDWFTLAVREVGARAPGGARLHPHGVRRGGASAARAIGVPLERIRGLGGWAPLSDVVLRYIDTTVAPCAAAVAFFGYMRPPDAAALALL